MSYKFYSIAFILLLLGALMLFGCDSLTSRTNAFFQAQLTVTDSLGNRQSVFEPGDPVFVTYRISNSSRTNQEYDYSMPKMYFQVETPDSVHHTSKDGCEFDETTQTEILNTGETIEESWNILDPWCLDEQVTLEEGMYLIQPGSNVDFDEMELEEPGGIGITISEEDTLDVDDINQSVYRDIR